jgi:urea transport system ATP-binding protein
MQSATTPALLYLDAVSVMFDGFRALNKLSLTLDANEMRAVIGPNGAGKTTMMDVITGKTRPTAGQVTFGGGQHDLTRLDEAAIAELGIGRKFQTPTVFDMHSVEDNLRLALKADRRAFPTLFWRESRAERERIDALLERVMLLAQEPKLLLIDEPAAGMTDQETADTADLLREIAKTRAVVVVEHDMTFVRDLGVKVTCLHEGSVLAEGPLDQVSANERVVEVYLGR